MAIKLQKGSGGSNIEIMEAGVYMARVVRIVDMGVQKREYKGEAKPSQQKLQFTFEFPTELIKVGDEEKPRWMSKTYGVSFTDLSHLTPLLKAIDPDGSKLEESVEALLDSPCQVTIEHYTNKDGDLRAAVGGVTQVMKGMDVAPLFNEAKSFAIDEPDMDMWADFPDWMKEEIRKAENFADSPLAELDAKEQE